MNVYLRNLNKKNRMTNCMLDELGNSSKDKTKTDTFCLQTNRNTIHHEVRVRKYDLNHFIISLLKQKNK